MNIKERKRRGAQRARGTGRTKREGDIYYIYVCIYFCGTAVPRSRDDKSDGDGLEITRALEKDEREREMIWLQAFGT